MGFADELRARLPGAEITYEPGCVTSAGVPAMDPRLIPDGLRIAYFGNAGFEGEAAGTDTLLQGQYIAMGKPVAGVPIAATSVRARGAFVPDVSGRWQIGVANAGLARVLIDGEVVVENAEDGHGGFFFGIGAGAIAGPVELTAGRMYELTVELRGHPVLPMAGFRLYAGRPVIADAMERAVAAARAADVAIIVVGSNSEAETEGKDRPGLHLIGEQDALVRRVLDANARTVVVVNAGSPVAMPWADDAAAILVVWYPGEEGAAALADMLTGVAEPGGRLPITFPRTVEDTPVHGAFYPGADGMVRYGEGVFVGYRHYDAHGIEPLFPFGHGLSYTTFEIGAPAVTSDAGVVRVAVRVANTGTRGGSAVVQVYVGAREAPVPRPPKELKAFARVALDAGASTVVVLELDDRAFAFRDVETHGWRVDPGAYDLHIGTSSRDIRHVVRFERPR